MMLSTMPFDKPVLSFAEGLRACPVPNTGANGINQSLPNVLFIDIIFAFYNRLALPGAFRSFVV